MKKIIIASVSALALLGLAACGDTDTTTTQSVQPEAQDTAPTVVPGADTNVIVVPETDENAPTDDTTTRSITPEADSMDDTTGTTGATPDGTLGADDNEPADGVRPVQ